jgi:hypothetical protein
MCKREIHLITIKWKEMESSIVNAVRCQSSNLATTNSIVFYNQKDKIK